MFLEGQKPDSKSLTAHLVYWLILLIGAVCFFVSVMFMPSNSHIGFVVGPNGTKSMISLSQQANWTTHLLDAAATAFLTVSAFEILKFAITFGVYQFTFRKNFDKFFGDDAVSRSDEGVIILQSDDVKDLLSSTKSITISPEDRALKARRWVNKWDFIGAREVSLMLRTKGLKAPKFEAAEHGSDFDSYSNAPFAIAMGLGFTDNTTILTADLPWLEISHDTHDGDCLRLRQELIRPRQTHFQPYEKQPSDIDGKGFIKLLPKEWDLEKWAEKPDNQPDYGLVLRRTFIIPSSKKRQVRFVLAGFTEVGTAAAGKYLSQRWEDLYERHVKGNLNTESKGDFLVVIDGLSKLDTDWSDSNFPAVTQKRIRECLGPEYPWSLHVPAQEAAKPS